MIAMATAPTQQPGTENNLGNPGTCRKGSNVSIHSQNPGSRRGSLFIPQEDVISGLYEFQRYDDNLEDYLDSLGLIGRDLGEIVRKTRFRIELKVPKKSDEKWTLVTYEYSKLG